MPIHIRKEGFDIYLPPLKLKTWYNVSAGYDGVSSHIVVTEYPKKKK
jgi:hypothetical protein